jgi:hypothetical protein
MLKAANGSLTSGLRKFGFDLLLIIQHHLDEFASIPSLSIGDGKCYKLHPTN